MKLENGVSVFLFHRQCIELWVHEVGGVHTLKGRVKGTTELCLGIHLKFLNFVANFIMLNLQFFTMFYHSKYSIILYSTFIISIQNLPDFYKF